MKTNVSVTVDGLPVSVVVDTSRIRVYIIKYVNYKNEPRVRGE